MRILRFLCCGLINLLLALFSMSQGEALASSDGCGDTSDISFVLRPGLDPCANDLNLLDPYNDSRGNLQLLLKAFVEPNLSEQSTKKVFSLDAETKAAQSKGVTIREFPQTPGETSGADGVCLSNDPDRHAEFIHEVVGSGLGKDELEKLVSLRYALARTCGGKKPFLEWLNTKDPEFAKLETSESAKDWFGYLKHSYEFYHSDLGSAVLGFSALSQSSQPWIAEVSLYLKGRSLLVQSQEGWDGYWVEGAGIDKNLAQQGKDALLQYLQKYPEGRYAQSARGLLRRAARFLGQSDDFRAAMFREFREMILKGSRSELENFQNEIEVYLPLWGTEIDYSAPLMAAELILMRERKEAQDEKLEINSQLLEQLDAHSKEFSSYPGLYEFLRLSLLYSMGRDEEVVKSLPQGTIAYELLPRSQAFLQAQSLDNLKRFDEAFVIYKKLREIEPSLPSSPPLAETEEDQKQVDLGSMKIRLGLAMLRNRLRARAFLDLSRSTEGEYPNLRPAFLQVVGEQALLEILSDEKSTKPNKELVSLGLLYQYLFSERFADFAKLYEKSEGWVQKEFAEVKDSVFTLLKKPNDARSLLTIGRFHENFEDSATRLDVLFNYSGAVPTSLTRSAHPWTILSEFYGTEGYQGYPKPIPGLRPFEYYKRARDAARSNPKDSELQAEILHYMIYCFRWSSCHGRLPSDAVPKKERLRWFQELKKKYKGTEWSENTEYYF